MSRYNIALYESNQRWEYRSQFNNGKSARNWFEQVCKVQSELPRDAICTVEKNGYCIAAQRFTRMHDVFKIDIQSESFCRFIQRHSRKKLESLSSLEHLPSESRTSYEQDVENAETTACSDAATMRLWRQHCQFFARDSSFAEGRSRSEELPHRSSRQLSFQRVPTGINTPLQGAVGTSTTRANNGTVESTSLSQSLLLPLDRVQLALKSDSEEVEGRTQSKEKKKGALVERLRGISEKSTFAKRVGRTWKHALGSKGAS